MLARLPSPSGRVQLASAYQSLLLKLVQCQGGPGGPRKVGRGFNPSACSRWCSRVCPARAGCFLVTAEDPANKWWRRGDSDAGEHLRPVAPNPYTNHIPVVVDGRDPDGELARDGPTVVSESALGA